MRVSEQETACWCLAGSREVIPSLVTEAASLPPLAEVCDL